MGVTEGNCIPRVSRKQQRKKKNRGSAQLKFIKCVSFPASDGQRKYQLLYKGFALKCRTVCPGSFHETDQVLGFETQREGETDAHLFRVLEHHDPEEINVLRRPEGITWH